MIPVGETCPDCNEPLPFEAFYETAEDQMRGKYKCPKCGRDTGWREKRFEVDVL